MLWPAFCEAGSGLRSSTGGQFHPTILVAYFENATWKSSAASHEFFGGEMKIGQEEILPLSSAVLLPSRTTSTHFEAVAASCAI